MDSIPDFWLAVFLVGGPLAATAVGIMVTARLQEHQKFSPIGDAGCAQRADAKNTNAVKSAPSPALAESAVEPQLLH